MKHYIGIDLGTTNSAICSYDGENVRVWKSPDQNDVTPSAIYIDKRGNRYYGQRAYNNAARSPENSATLFKRFMGTDEKIQLKGAGITMKPEECSAEILKVLFGYLPEEIRSDPETPVVITVPAAFNQMKKDATLEAANLAGFGRVTLMQEPVAAVMSVMKHSNTEGTFLIYDLGGGTFDLSIAENIGGTVNLLSHGGIEMCGGRDWDRIIVNKVVIPWLKSNFKLPDNLMINPRYKLLLSLSHWASERAKIELSSNEEAIISLSESESRCMDEDGEEIYIDIPISRSQLNSLISELVDETIEATRETMQKAGLTANDIDRIVFVGGPSNYKPLRDKVCTALALKADTNVNPMTAVAEGASIFAESINWETEKHTRKEKRAEVKTDLNFSFNYTARTSEDSARIVFFSDAADGYTVEVISYDTGWSSGRASLRDRMALSLPLSRQGDNRFEVKVYDRYGNAIRLEENNITITKTYATIGSIPASQSIGVEVLNTLGGSSILDFMVREGDALPKKGTMTFKAGESLKAGSASSINIKLWEGNIESPIEDNRPIGVMKVLGTDFDYGIVPTGSEIICDYEMGDSGNLSLEVSIPCIGATFKNKNFYSRQEGQKDALNAEKIADDGASLLDRINRTYKGVQDHRLESARKKAQNAASAADYDADPEAVQKASNDLLEAKKSIYAVRKDHLPQIRQSELDSCRAFYESDVRKYTRSTEADAYENLFQTAQRAIDRNESNFEDILDRIRGKNFEVLWRQDWFVVEWFRVKISNPYNYADQARFQALKAQGEAALRNNRMEELRKTVIDLIDIEIRSTSIEDMLAKTNIVRG